MAVPEPDTVGDRVPVVVRVPVLVAEVVGDILPATEIVGEVEAEREGCGEKEEEGLAVEDRDARLLRDAAPEAVWEAEMAPVRVADDVVDGL